MELHKTLASKELFKVLKFDILLMRINAISLLLFLLFLGFVHAEIRTVNYPLQVSDQITYLGSLYLVKVNVSQVSSIDFGSVEPAGLSIGNFTNTGLDLVISLKNGTLLLLRQNGFGKYNISSFYTSPSYARAITSGDFDNDGHLDIAAINDTYVFFLKGNGAGSFTLQGNKLSLSYDSPGCGITSADFDNNGILDIAIGHGGYVSHYRGQGSFSFSLIQDKFLTLNNPCGMASGDIDEDGYVDLVVGDANGQVWMFPNSNGLINNIGQRPQTPPGAQNAYYLSVGNIFKTNDSHFPADLGVLVGDGTKNITYFAHEFYLPPGNPTPLRGAEVLISQDEEIRGIALGDFDRNRAQDLALLTKKHLYIYYNMPNITKKTWVESNVDYAQNISTYEITFSHQWHVPIQDIDLIENIPSTHSFYQGVNVSVYSGSSLVASGSFAPTISGTVLNVSGVLNRLGLSSLNSSQRVVMRYKLQKTSSAAYDTYQTNLTYKDPGLTTYPSDKLLSHHVSNPATGIQNIINPGSSWSRNDSYTGVLLGPELLLVDQRAYYLACSFYQQYYVPVETNTKLVPNRSMKVIATVNNTGNVSTYTNVEFYLNAGLNQTKYVNISAGGRTDVEFYFTPGIVGAYTYNNYVNKDRVVDEWNTSNNNLISDGSFFVYQLPNIVAINLTNITVTREGSAVTLEATVNFTSSPEVVPIYYRYAFTWQGGIYCDGTDYINATGLKTVRSTCYLPLNYTGNKQVNFTITYVCPGETTASDNNASANIFVLSSPPDLTVRGSSSGFPYGDDYFGSSSFKYKEIDSNTIQFEAVIENNGGQDANNFNVSIIGNVSGFINSTIMSLSKYSSQLIYLNWSHGPITQDERITIYVDYTNVVAESNENNNNASLVIRPKSIDVVPVRISLSNDYPNIGEEVIAYARIANKGNASATNFNVYFYLDGALIKNETIDFVPPNAYSRFIYTNFTVTKGVHNLSVVVNPSPHSLIESNYTNNYFYRLVHARNWSVTLLSVSNLKHNDFANATVRVNNSARMPLLISAIELMLWNSSRNTTVHAVVADQYLKNYKGIMIHPSKKLFEKAKAEAQAKSSCYTGCSTPNASNAIDGDENTFIYPGSYLIDVLIDLNESKSIDEVHVKKGSNVSQISIEVGTKPNQYTSCQGASYTSVYYANLDPEEEGLVTAKFAPVNAECVRISGSFTSSKKISEVYIYETNVNDSSYDFNITFYVPLFNATRVYAFADAVYTVGGIWERVRGYRQNLILNPSFEYGVVNWSYPSVSGLKVNTTTSYFVDGISSLIINATSPGVYKVNSTKINALVSGRNYTVSGYLYALTLNGGAWIEINELNSSGVVRSVASTVISSTTANFIRLNFTYTAVSDVAVVSLVLQGSGVIFFDAILMEEGNDVNDFFLFTEKYTRTFDEVNSTYTFDYDMHHGRKDYCNVDFGLTYSVCYYPSTQYWGSGYQSDGFESGFPRLQGHHYYKRKLFLPSDAYALEFNLENICYNRGHLEQSEFWVNNFSLFNFTMSNQVTPLSVSEYRTFLLSNSSFTIGNNYLVVKTTYPLGCVNCNVDSQGDVLNWIRIYQRKGDYKTVVTDSVPKQWFDYNVSAQNLKKGQYAKVYLNISNKLDYELKIAEIRFYTNNGILYTDIEPIKLLPNGVVRLNYSVYVPNTSLGDLKVAVFANPSFNSWWKVGNVDSSDDRTKWLIDSVSRAYCLRITNNIQHNYSYYRPAYQPLNTSFYLVALKANFSNGSLYLNDTYLYTPVWKNYLLWEPSIRVVSSGYSNLSAIAHIYLKNTSLYTSYVLLNKSVGTPASYSQPVSVLVSAPSSVRKDEPFNVTVNISSADDRFYATAVRIELRNATHTIPLATRHYMFRNPTPYGQRIYSNLINNGDFEQDFSNENWVSFGFTRNSYIKYSGTYSSDLVAGSTQKAGSLEQNVTLRFGRVYLLRGWGYVTNGVVNFSLLPNGLNSFAYQKWGDCGLTSTAGWQMFECYLLVNFVPEKTNNSRLAVNATANANSAVYLDNISLIEYPDLPANLTFTVKAPVTGSYNVVAYVEKFYMPNKFWLFSDTVSASQATLPNINHLLLPTDNGDFYSGEIFQRNLYRNDLLLPDGHTVVQLRAPHLPGCSYSSSGVPDCMVVMYQNGSVAYYSNNNSYPWKFYESFNNTNITMDAKALEGDQIPHFMRVYERISSSIPVTVNAPGSLNLNVSINGRLYDGQTNNITLVFNNTLGKAVNVYGVRLDVHNSTSFVTTIAMYLLDISIPNGSVKEVNLTLTIPYGLRNNFLVAKAYLLEEDYLDGWRYYDSMTGNFSKAPFVSGVYGWDAYAMYSQGAYGSYYGYQGDGESSSSSDNYYHFTDKHVSTIYSSHEIRVHNSTAMSVWRNNNQLYNTTGSTNAYTKWTYFNDTGIFNITVKSPVSELTEFYFDKNKLNVMYNPYYGNYIRYYSVYSGNTSIFNGTDIPIALHIVTNKLKTGYYNPVGVYLFNKPKTYSLVKGIALELWNDTSPVTTLYMDGKTKKLPIVDVIATAESSYGSARQVIDGKLDLNWGKNQFSTVTGDEIPYPFWEATESTSQSDYEGAPPSQNRYSKANIYFDLGYVNVIDKFILYNVRPEKEIGCDYYELYATTEEDGWISQMFKEKALGKRKTVDPSQDTTEWTLIKGTELPDVTASTYFQNSTHSFEPRYGVDGQVSTQWRAAVGANSGNPQWLRIDMNEPRDFDKVMVLFGGSNSQVKVSIQIQISNDTTNYQTVSSVDQQLVSTIQYYNFSFATKKARYIRIFITSFTTQIGENILPAVNETKIMLGEDYVLPKPAVSTGFLYNQTVIDMNKTLARYIKLTCEAQSGFAGLAEVEAVASNVLSANASSVDPSYPTANAFDGDLTTQFISQSVPSNSNPVVLLIDHGRAVWFNGLMLITGNTGVVSNYTISVSNDTTMWYDVYANSNDVIKLKYIQFSQNMSARYLRISITGTSDGNKASINETGVMWDNSTYNSISLVRYQPFVANSLPQKPEDLTLLVKTDIYYLVDNVFLVKPGVGSSAITLQNDLDWVVDVGDHYNFSEYYRKNIYIPTNAFAFEIHTYTSGASAGTYEYANGNLYVTPSSIGIPYRTVAHYLKGMNNVYVVNATLNVFYHRFMDQIARVYFRINRTVPNIGYSSLSPGTYVNYVYDSMSPGENKIVKVNIFNDNEEMEETHYVEISLQSGQNLFMKIGNFTVVNPPKSKVVRSFSYVVPYEGAYSNGYLTKVSGNEQSWIQFCNDPSYNKVLYANGSQSIVWNSSSLPSGYQDFDYAYFYVLGLVTKNTSSNFNVNVNGNLIGTYTGALDNSSWNDGSIRFVKFCDKVQSIGNSVENYTLGLFVFRVPSSVISSQNGVQFTISGTLGRNVTGIFNVTNACQYAGISCPQTFSLASAQYNLQAYKNYTIADWDSWYVKYFENASNVSSANAHRASYNDQEWLIDEIRPAGYWRKQDTSWSYVYKSYAEGSNTIYPYSGTFNRRHFVYDEYMNEKFNVTYYGYSSFSVDGTNNRSWQYNDLGFPGAGKSSVDFKDYLRRSVDTSFALAGFVDSNPFVSGRSPVLVIDLVPVSLNVNTSTACENTKVNISIKIKNIGQIESGNFTVSLYINHRENVIKTFYNVSLLPQSETILNFTWDSTMYGGFNTIGVLIDAENVVAEVNEKNNDFWSLYYLCPACSVAELVVTPALISVSDLETGQTQYANITVQNTGDISATNVNVSSYLNDVLVDSRVIPEINRSSNATFTLTLGPLSSGYYRLRVEVDPGNTISECNDLDYCSLNASDVVYENNNATRGFAVYTDSGPDLVVEDIYVMKNFTTSKAEGIISLGAMISNIGSSTDSSFTVSFYDEKYNVDIGDVIVLGGINQRDKVYLSISKSYPQEMIGNNRIKVTVDKYDSITEVNESNNEFTKEMYIDNPCSDCEVVVYSPLNATYTITQIPINYTWRIGSAAGTKDASWYYNTTHNVTYSGPVVVGLSEGFYNFFFYVNTTTGLTCNSSVSFTVNTSVQPLKEYYLSYNPVRKIVYIPAGNMLVAINITTGNVLWNYTSDGNVSQVSIAGNDAVAFGDTSGNVYVLNGLNGNLLWSTNVGYRVNYVVIADENVFVATNDRMFAFCRGS